MAVVSRHRKRILQQAAERHGIDPAVLYGVYGVESRFGHNTGPSPAGARGNFQFMPKTAASLGVRIGDFKSEANGAARYLAQYKSRGTAGMLAAYNAGPAGNPNNPETRAYIPQVLSYAKQFHGSGRVLGRPGTGAIHGGLSVSPVEPNDPGPLTSLLQQPDPGPRPSLGVPPPQHTALSLLRDARPAEAKVVDSAGGGAPPPVSPLEQLAAARALEGDPGQATVGPGAVPTGSPGGKAGPVSVAPGANRAGTHLAPALTGFLRRVAGRAGPVRVTTGTNHSRFVQGTSRVSDHASGNAADIAVPVDSAQGDHIAGAALVALGVPRLQARRMAQRGGLFTISRGGVRYQVIWKTFEGGNHHNHVHIGARPA